MNELNTVSEILQSKLKLPDQRKGKKFSLKKKKRLIEQSKLTDKYSTFKIGTRYSCDFNKRYLLFYHLFYILIESVMLY